MNLRAPPVRSTCPIEAHGITPKTTASLFYSNG